MMGKDFPIVLGKYVVNLSMIVNQMAIRLDEMAARERKITVSHDEVKQLMKMIRIYAGEFCDKYGLPDPKPVRAAMKKDLMKRSQIKDLHDLPENAITGAMNYLEHYSNIRLVMSLKTGPGD